MAKGILKSLEAELGFDKHIAATGYASEDLLVRQAIVALRSVGDRAPRSLKSAKVGTGIVAELGAMRVPDEIDALEVMGIDSMV